MKFFLNGSIFAAQSFRGSIAPFATHLVTRLATATNGRVVLSCSFCCKCKPLDSSRRPRKDKFGLVSAICNRQQNAKLVGYTRSFCVNHINLSRKAEKQCNCLPLSLVPVVLAEIHGFKWVIG